jgi:Sulfotransferase domain
MNLSLRNLLQPKRENNAEIIPEMTEEKKAEKSILAFHEKYFTPISQVDPKDIFIAGYPKSGNTWFQDLIVGLVFGIISEHTHPRLIADLIPDVHYKPFYIRYQTPTYFKTHFKPLPEYQNVIYLLRDGRDAMVSYWHYISALRKGEVDFLELVRTGQDIFPCKWHEHVEAWMANPYKARILVIKYEDLLTEPVRELERFCAFSGIEANTSDLERASGGASFAKMLDREKRKGTCFDEDSGWPKEQSFRRRGVAGSFRDEMPDEVQKAFLLDAEETLKKQGYTI